SQLAAHICFGLLGDIASRPRHVRFSFKANSKKANSYCYLPPRAYRSCEENLKNVCEKFTGFVGFAARASERSFMW
ncbi:MAG: hypothetical protein WBG18_15540, partial [Xanthobacteraceae bacterium]